MGIIFRTIQTLFMLCLATLLASTIALAEHSSSTAGTSTFERTDSGEWYIFIPSLIADISEGRELLNSQRDYWNDVELEIQRLEKKSAAMRSIEVLNEMLGKGLGIELEHKRGVYVLTAYYHQSGRVLRSGMRLPAHLSEYDLPALLTPLPAVEETTSAVVSGLFGGDDDCLFCDTQEDWEEWQKYVDEMLEILCNSTTPPSCYTWSSSAVIGSNGRMIVSGYYMHIDGSMDMDYLYAEFIVAPEGPPKEAIEI